MEIPPVAAPTKVQAQGTDADLMSAARELEASFLAEMLKAAGLGTSRETFGGGAGEDQFASFLVDEQARHMVDAGGIGLAEALFHSLKDRQNDKT